MPSSWPVFADDEIAAAQDVLRTGLVNYWTGTQGRLFEQEFAAYVGVSHAVALANGTLALELALRATGIGAGDHVLVPARTFIGTATAVVAAGARPVVADVDRKSGLVTAATLAAALTPETRGVIVVHLAGWPCDMEAIMRFAHDHDLVVIEDCAQAHGTRIGGRAVGSFGHASAFSFCTDKIISTCGEGGMLVTDDSAIWRRAWEYKDHGRDLDALERSRTEPGREFKWLISSFGTNWRMTEMQAAVGRVQLGKLNEWVAHRRRNAAILDDVLIGVPGLRVTVPPVAVEHAYYKYYAHICPDLLSPGWNRSRILTEITSRGFAATQGICPEIYRERAFVERGWAPAERLATARELGETSLMLQVDPTISHEEIRVCAGVIAGVMREATVMEV